MEEQLRRYQDPANADQIMRIQKYVPGLSCLPSLPLGEVLGQRAPPRTPSCLLAVRFHPHFFPLLPPVSLRNLDETRDVLHNTIDSVLQRGEKLEDLVERSGELSAQSKLFYKQAKKANGCCAVV